MAAAQGAAVAEFNLEATDATGLCQAGLAGSCACALLCAVQHQRWS